MLKRGLAILLLALLVSALSSVVQAGGEGDAALEDKLAQLENAIDDLEEMVKGIAFDAQKLGGLESIVKEISFQMKSSEGKIRNLLAFQQDLQPRMAELESKVSGLSFTVQKHGEKLTKLEGLSEVVAELQPRVFSLETTVEGLVKKLEGVDDQLRKLSGVPDKIADLDERLVKLEGILAQISPEDVDIFGIKELKDKVFVLQSSLADLASIIDEGKLASLEGRLSALEDRVAVEMGTLDERVTGVEQSINNLRNWTTVSTIMAVAAVAYCVYLTFFAE